MDLLRDMEAPRKAADKVEEAAFLQGVSPDLAMGFIVRLYADQYLKLVKGEGNETNNKKA